VLGVLVLFSGCAAAQNYPNKPIRVITADTGGGADLVARVVAQGMSAALGQQVIVENRGGSAVIPGTLLAKAPADGYTLLLYGSTIWLVPFMQDAAYDPVKDFAPVAQVAGSPTILVVHPSIPATSVKDLIALAKAHPGELNYGGALPGSSTELAAELFKAMAKVNLVRVSYKGAGPALIDLLAGQIQVMFGTTGAIMPHIKSGRLRALAVTSLTPSPLLPGMPAVAATLPGYQSEIIYAMFAPAGTPAAIVTRLNQEIRRDLAMPDIKDKLFRSGIATAPGTPEELGIAMKTDMTRMGKVIRDAGIHSK
jgi:tripartite-type tricarboxylate transporter receptor subunit TctC